MASPYTQYFFEMKQAMQWAELQSPTRNMDYIKKDLNPYIGVALSLKNYKSLEDLIHPGHSGSQTANRTNITEMSVNLVFSLRFGFCFLSVRSSGLGSVSSLQNPNYP